MKYPTLLKACDHRGASMGRPSSIMEPDAVIKFRLYAMPMSRCGCYDSGGAYWGAGDHKTGWMYHAIGMGLEYVNEIFIRAYDRNDAKERVLGIFKNAKFYR